MPAVNRESQVSLQSFELEQAEAPRAGSSVSPVATQQVESYEASKSTSPLEQHGLAVGSISASSVRSLDSKAVISQVKELMGGWMVSDDDCRHAVGLLQSLPPAQYGKALEALSKSGDLKTLCEKTPAALRRDLAESAVQGGATTSTPERLSRGLKDPQPPAQPAMIVNSPSLPKELREVIHKENQARAGQYEAAFSDYVEAWCAKVKTCKTPRELRELGPISSPPALTEPGISSADFAARRFTSLHTHSGLGAEAAAKAVSNQVSVFRNELAAGSFGLTAGLEVKAGVEGPLAGHVEGGAGWEVGTSAMITDDGRALRTPVKSEKVAELGHGHAVKGELKLSHEGHLEEVGVEVLGAGLELKRDGEMTFKAPIPIPGAKVETFVNPNEAKFGAAVSQEAEGKLFGVLNVKVEGKLGITGQGIAREYYQDIGGAQEGFFGPMPELDAGAKWSDLKKERRDWYHRQGFDENNWPSA